ncbi:cell surface protein [Methanosarcina barkeri str. Wiesmoor]|uniref:Cell surface protein n=1 Tax=Methanosarcina barkeri str. Wiesmoor TaxID=1434109 RepID=A0A0E3QLY6_METBA|nr:cell surface protein [Methanosarcina barkeri str. Wiesmoor]
MGINVGNKIIHLALILIFLISFTSIAKADKETMIVSWRLTLSPSIYGNVVTWADTFGNGVFMYNLTTGNITGIGHSESSSSIIQGDKITWWDYGNITVYNISTGKKIEIINASTPAIYGDNIVYVRSKYADCQPASNQNAEYNSLYLYNLSTHKEVQLIPYTHAIYGASIYENKIVWTRTNRVNPGEWSTNISIYDIPTKRVSDISRSGRAGNGKIYGNIVVWTENQNGSRYVYMRDIAKHKTRQVTFDGNPISLDVYGDRIIWERKYWVGNNLSNDIYIYNISTNETTRITSARDPDIYDDKIVYIRSSNDTENQEGRNIYLYNLSA